MKSLIHFKGGLDKSEISRDDLRGAVAPAQKHPPKPLSDKEFTVYVQTWSIRA
jgi:hypothetical protein